MTSTSSYPTFLQYLVSKKEFHKACEGEACLKHSVATLMRAIDWVLCTSGPVSEPTLACNECQHAYGLSSNTEGCATPNEACGLDEHQVMLCKSGTSSTKSGTSSNQSQDLAQIGKAITLGIAPKGPCITDNSYVAQKAFRQEVVCI